MDFRAWQSVGETFLTCKKILCSKTPDCWSYVLSVLFFVSVVYVASFSEFYICTLFFTLMEISSFTTLFYAPTANKTYCSVNESYTSVIAS